jgi:ribosomal protein S18 acetylase RimI-like enzyme
MHVASWLETYPGIVPDSMLASLSIERRTENWKRILDDPSQANGTSVYVAELAGKIFGFGSCGVQRTASLSADGYPGEITGIYILRECQGRGLGRELMATMAADISARGYGGVSLWVLRDNFQARRFYESLKGSMVAEREDVRGDVTLVEVAYGWPDLNALRLQLS